MSLTKRRKKWKWDLHQPDQPFKTNEKCFNPNHIHGILSNKMLQTSCDTFLLSFTLCLLDALLAFGLKETPEQVFSCEFYKIFKNIWENLWTTSSVFQFPWKFLTRQVDYMLANCVEFTFTSGLKRKLPPGGVFGKSCFKISKHSLENTAKKATTRGVL